MATTEIRPMGTIDAAVTATQLDPVTFEVLKNSFVNLVDQMSEQMLRTCYSFVIYARDFSNCLCDANGDTVMQGSQDIAVHVGTLHYSAKAVLDAFKDDLHPGDVVAVNDPTWVAPTSATSASSARFSTRGFSSPSCRPTGTGPTLEGTVPGSFDITAKEHYGEGLRIPPVKIWDKGEYRADVARLLVSNMRLSDERLGDLARPSGGHPHRRGVSAPTHRQVRRRYRRRGDVRMPELCRAADSGLGSRNSRKAPGRRTISSTSTPTKAKVWSASTSS